MVCVPVILAPTVLFVAGRKTGAGQEERVLAYVLEGARWI